MRRALLVVVAGLALVSAPGAAARPRASLTDIEQQVMCVTCGVPLAIAESPQADRERAFIRGLIARGETTSQIKRELVAQFGREVLALPKSSGFDLAAYAVPAGAVLVVLGLLAFALPRWRRRGAAIASTAPTPALTSEDAARLDAELARYEA